MRQTIASIDCSEQLLLIVQRESMWHTTKDFIAGGSNHIFPPLLGVTHLTCGFVPPQTAAEIDRAALAPRDTSKCVKFGGPWINRTRRHVHIDIYSISGKCR